MPLHIVQRGVNRNPCFFAADDYETYVHFMAAAAQRFGCAIHAYCLMTNHVHLLVTPEDEQSCGAFMKHLGQCYVQTINRRHQRTGTLWGGRFRSCLVKSDEYVLACYRYIELNPVRAGMARTPAEHPWSSYRANTGLIATPFVRPHLAYEALGHAGYRELCADAIPEPDLEEIRKATRLGCVIGTRRRGRGRQALVK